MALTGGDVERNAWAAMMNGEQAMDADRNRRDVLRLAGSSLLALAALVIAGPARAFRYDPAEDYAGVIEDSCGAANKIHRDMVAQVERQLGISLSDEQARQVIAAVQCPYCGCSILKGVADASQAPF
jgi:hypothetical protein